MANASATGSTITVQKYFEAFSPAEADNRLAMSGDGSTVVFGSVAALTPGAEVAAAAGAQSVYEYHSTASISNGNVYQISDGTDASGTATLGLDTSGGDVFFNTADPLLAQDVDTQVDLYDARAGGGFPEPLSVGCDGEACHGTPLIQPTFGAPGSSSAQAGGNLPPQRPVVTAVKPKVQLTQAQKLVLALKACRHSRGKRRATCESQARRRYRVRSTAHGKGRR
jgi:hypothetical protein